MKISYSERSKHMKKVIAVEDSLSPVKNALQQEGYDVTYLGDNRSDAIIISGMNENFMGMEDIRQDVPVINAQGKSTEEVIEELKNKM